MMIKGLIPILSAQHAFILAAIYIGFSAPTAGYMLDLSQRGRQGPDFLAASVYEMQWDSNGFFYACTSHSEHKTVIVRWDASL
jgi:hypothetical protein